MGQIYQIKQLSSFKIKKNVVHLHKMLITSTQSVVLRALGAAALTLTLTKVASIYPTTFVLCFFMHTVAVHKRNNVKARATHTHTLYADETGRVCFELFSQTNKNRLLKAIPY